MQKIQLISYTLYYIGYKSWEVWHKMCCVWSSNNFELMCGAQNASHYHPDISNYSRREHEGRRLESQLNILLFFYLLFSIYLSFDGIKP